MEERKYALQVIQQVMLHGGYITLALRKCPSNLNIGWITQAVNGTIRNWLLLEYQTKQVIQKKNRRLEPLIYFALYQALMMENEAPYAVVNEMVSLAKKQERGFVNAVLRKCIQQGLQKPPLDSLEHIATLTSHPLWILQLFAAHYGEQVARQIAFENQKPAHVYVRKNTLKYLSHKVNIDWLSETLGIASQPVQSSLAFQEGEILIQDRHSQMVVEQMTIVPGMHVLDLCAAPGTKSQQIACALQNQGTLISNDIYAHRVQLIKVLFQKTGVTCGKVDNQDATMLYEPWIECFDRVLCDVPCSGLGDLRHKPEIRFSLKPESLDELIIIQQNILETASCYVKVDGHLIYSTCTLNRKENERQIQHFLKQHDEFELWKERTLFPFDDHSDGFYYAVLVKKGKGYGKI